jgi:gluconate 5-dehydrogenase
MFSLSGKVALVTGASRGLGYAMAQALARFGARVVVAARNVGGIDHAVSQLRAESADAHGLAVDLLDEVAVVAAVPRVVREHGRLDILVNNAGVCVWSGLAESTLEVWRRTLDTNLTASYMLSREAARVMVAQRSGRIINIGSYVSVLGRERLQAYAASKHGLAGLTKSIAGDVGRHGVTCNAIAPGLFLTEMAAPVTRDAARMQVFTNAIAMGRWGDPQELAGPVVFLASAAGSYVNGHILHVDGGIADVLSLPTAVSS